MKTRTICGLTVLLALLATPAMADLYVVDFTGGTTYLAPPTISLSGWGEYESSTGVGYGDIGLNNSMMVKGNDASGDATYTATITYPTDILSVEIRHLAGLIDDTFSVDVDGADWGSYTDALGGETWVTTSFSGTPGSVLTLTITNPNPTWAATWGQLAIDKVEAVPVPLPGAVLLGFLGLGYAGRKLRSLV